MLVAVYNLGNKTLPYLSNKDRLGFLHNPALGPAMRIRQPRTLVRYPNHIGIWDLVEEPVSPALEDWFRVRDTKLTKNWVKIPNSKKKGIGLWLPLKFHQPLPKKYKLKNSFLKYLMKTIHR